MLILGARRSLAKQAIFRPANMDELPIPCGSWKAHHEAKQKKYYLDLAIGILSLIISLAAIKVENIEFNYSPPPMD